MIFMSPFCNWLLTTVKLVSILFLWHSYGGALIYAFCANFIFTNIALFVDEKSDQ